MTDTAAPTPKPSGSSKRDPGKLDLRAAPRRVVRYAGLEDEVDYHTWRLIRGIALATLLGVGTELSLGSDESDLVRAIRESAQQNVNRAGQRITGKSLNIHPKYYLRVRLDDPSLSEPFTAALFPSEEGDRAQLVWNRRREG